MEKVIKAIFIFPIRVYQYAISPMLGANCRFTPTCSAYTVQAIEEWGPLKGTWMGIRRFSKCHPWGGHGYDPVPSKSEEIKTSTIDQDIEQLVSTFLENENESIVLLALGKLVETSTEDNYHEIIDFIEQHPSTSELDLSMYIHDIAIKGFKGLDSEISKLKVKFTDPDAIEDLMNAEEFYLKK